MGDGWVEDVMNPRQCLLELWNMPRSIDSFFVFFLEVPWGFSYDEKRNGETTGGLSTSSLFIHRCCWR